MQQQSQDGYSRRASDGIESVVVAPDEPIACNPGTLADPLPAVERAMASFRRAVRGRPLLAYSEGREALARLRERAAATFGGAPHNWAMADGHTATIDRLSNVIGQLFGRGVRVVSTDNEHVGGLGAFSADPRVVVEHVPVDRIAETDGSLFFISHLAYDTNRDNSDAIRALSRRSDHPIVIVDGSQAVGQVPVDVSALGCHAYCSSAHKWLGGPQGTGLLYLRDDVLATWPSPFRAGEPLCPELAVGRWEPRGGQDFSRIAGLTAAIEEYARCGERGRELVHRFAAGLRRTVGSRVRIVPDSAPQGRVVVFEVIGADVYPIYRALSERGLAMKCIKKDAGATRFEVLRAGFPWWTPASRVREAVTILNDVLRQAAPVVDDFTPRDADATPSIPLELLAPAATPTLGENLA